MKMNIKKCCQIYEFIYNEKLDKAYEIKPLINGKDLAKLIGVKTGPSFKTYIDNLIDWQLENPNGTIDDYKVYLDINHKRD